MTAYTTEIAPRATIAQLVGIRDRALTRYKGLLAEAKAIGDLIAPLNAKAYTLPSITVSTDRGRSYYSTDAEAFRKQLDGAAWDNLLTTTALRDLMSAKQQGEWRDMIEKDPPEFTIDNVVATFDRMRGQADAIFRQGIVDVFEALPRDFRSHDGFKLGARCVMESAVTPRWSSGYYWRYGSYGHDPRAKLADLDRTFHQLAGEEWTHKAADIAASAMEDGKGEVDTRFFRLRWFKNGNLHVWFTDKETTQKANRLLAEHYGPALGKMHLHPDQRGAA